MKRAFALAVVLWCGGRVVAAHGYDRDAIVSWRNIVGVISAPGVDNPVAVTTDHHGNVVSQIHSGTLPWVTRAGTATVDLTTGTVRFAVYGLVLIGGNASGTPGPVNQVVGTVVCNPGSTHLNRPQAIIDTPPVTLSPHGNATFAGELSTQTPLTCNDPLFLIRIGPAFGTSAGRWLASGVEPRFGQVYEFRSDSERGYDRR